MKQRSGSRRRGAVAGLACPVPGDPAKGDKTPAVMRWWLEHHPEEFERRYGRRVHPMNHDGGRDEEEAVAAEVTAPPGFWDPEEEDDDEVAMRPPKVFL